MQNETPSVVVPAIISGLGFGFLSGVPLCNLGCCLWALGAGATAAYMTSRTAKQINAPFTAGGGAVAGVLSGGVFGLVGGLVTSIIQTLLGAFDADSIADQVAQNPMVSPEDFEQVSQMLESSGPLFFVLVIVFMWFLTGLIFGTIGGLIGGAAFKNEPTADEAVPPPPPPIG